VRLGLTADGWDWVRRTRRETELLTVAECGGLDAARSWLGDHGLTWIEAACSSGPTSQVVQPYGWRDDARLPLGTGWRQGR
jgi:hypothetical protein